MSETNNETNMIDEKIHKTSEIGNDTLHLIDDKLDEIITKTIVKIEDKDNTISKTKTKTKTKDKDKTIPKAKTKTKDKDDDINMDENRPIQVFQYARLGHNRENGDWVKRQIVWVFWNNKHISELCEKWIYRNCEYGYTQFEELRTYSGEVLFTREHKATITKHKRNIFTKIIKLGVFKDFINN